MTPVESSSEWAAEMSALAKEFVRGFEARFGYPPGSHEIRSAPAVSRDSSTRWKASGVPKDLLDFYSAVEEVSLPDVWNGYFIHHVNWVLGDVGSEQPARLTGTVEDRIVVFGSDGGGALFALSMSGRGVYRVTGGRFMGRGMPYEGGDVTVVAPDIRRFLDFLRDELRAALTG